MSQFLAQKVVLEVFKAWQSSNNVRHALLDFIVRHKERNQRTRFAARKLRALMILGRFLEEILSVRVVR